MNDPVGRAREEFERRLADARSVVTRELGHAPRLAWWFLPVAAAMVGLAIGMRRRRRRRVSRPSGA